jgi:hypothetical protein
MSEGKSIYKCAECNKTLHAVTEENAPFTQFGFSYLRFSEENTISAKGAYFVRSDGLQLSQHAVAYSES